MMLLNRSALVASLSLAALIPAVAQTGQIEVRTSSSLAGTRQHPVMVSVIQNDGVVQQGETVVPSGRKFEDLKPGVYDVRVEGSGIVTQVKRGVHVIAGQTLNLEYALTAGTGGAEVTHYANAVLSREELEARVRKLEAQVAELQQTVTQLKAAAKP
jgi:hypothetical protein